MHHKKKTAPHKSGCVSVILTSVLVFLLAFTLLCFVLLFFRWLFIFPLFAHPAEYVCELASDIFSIKRFLKNSLCGICT